MELLPPWLVKAIQEGFGTVAVITVVILFLNHLTRITKEFQISIKEMSRSFSESQKAGHESVLYAVKELMMISTVRHESISSKLDNVASQQIAIVSRPPYLNEFRDLAKDVRESPREK